MRIQRGQYSSLLRRIMGATGASDVISDLAPELAAGFTLEDQRPEWEFLKGAKLMSMPIGVTGVAGQTAGIKIRNPANSGVVAVFGPPFSACIEISCLVVGASQADISLFQQPEAANLATSTAPIPRDSRITSIAAGTSALIGSQTNNLGATNLGFLYTKIFLSIGTPYQFTHNFVLTPGNEISLASPTVQTSLLGGFHWLEKRLDDLEKTQ